MKRILLVEDEEDVRTILMLVLREAGYLVDSVRTAAAARLYLTQHRDYALVLTDWQLGAADDNGVAIADMAVSKGVRAIIVTGLAAKMLEPERARHEVFQKPVRQTELIRAVKRQIGPGRS